MEHNPSQERAWKVLVETLTEATRQDYAVDSGHRHQLRIGRRAQPIREAILNFAGEDLFIHLEEGGRSRGLPDGIRVSEEGNLSDLRMNAPVTIAQIVSRVREYLAA